MTQPPLKVSQLDQDELTLFVAEVATAGAALGGQPVIVNEPNSGQVLQLDSGSPLTWRNATLGLGFVAGSGIDSDALEGSPQTLAVDSTVIRTNATNTFQQANTFTAAISAVTTGPAVFSSAAPGIILNETDAAVDNRLWRMFANGTVLTFDIRNDAGSTTNNWLTVGRSGATVGAIALFGTSLTFNGEPVIVGGSPYAGGGGGLGSPQVVTGDLTVTGDIFYGSPIEQLPYEVLLRQATTDSTTYASTTTLSRVADLELPQAPANSEWIFEGQLEVLIGGTGPLWEINFTGGFDDLKMHWYANDVNNTELTGFSSGALGSAGGESNNDDPGRSTGAERLVTFKGTFEKTGTAGPVGIAVRPQTSNAVPVQIIKNSWCRFTRLA